MLATNKEGDNCLRFKIVIDWHDEDENICIKNSDDEEIDCIINITYPINKKFDAKEINKIIYNYLRKNLNSSSCDFIIKKLSELSPDFIRDAYLLCLITNKNRDLDLMFKNIHDYNKTGDIVYPLTLDGYYEAYPKGYKETTDEPIWGQYAGYGDDKYIIAYLEAINEELPN